MSRSAASPSSVRARPGCTPPRRWSSRRPSWTRRCAVRVDVLDRLPTPYGLVRYGVAPDHPSIKSIAELPAHACSSTPSVRFLGGVHLGDDVTREDLLASYDAVVYATGAMRDRRMGIPGEDLPGSYAATDFVNWYCGHPDIDPGAFTLDAESVAVIGVGNVAVDVARILVRDPDELRAHRRLAAGARRADGQQGPRGARDRPPRPGPGQVHHQGAARARRARRGRHRGGRRPRPTWPRSTRPGRARELAESDRRVRGNLAVIGDWAARCPDWSARRATAG